jgi:hypothetical protein
VKFRKFAAVAVAGSLMAAPALAQVEAAAAGAEQAQAVGAKLLEGTELPMQLEEPISSKSAKQGDRFTISLVDDVKLADGTILRAGYRGMGEVLDANDSGMLGKTGKLAVRVNYIRVGDQRIKLRASRDVQGAHNTGVQVGALLLLWPVLPFIKGKNTQLKKGTVFNAFVDEDVILPTPMPPPPADL